MRTFPGGAKTVRPDRGAQLETLGAAVSTKMQATGLLDAGLSNPKVPGAPLVPAL
jgi:hypothetical protein